MVAGAAAQLRGAGAGADTDAAPLHRRARLLPPALAATAALLLESVRGAALSASPLKNVVLLSLVLPSHIIVLRFLHV